MQYVIIGNSHAAVGAIEGIRSVDRKGSIIVLSSENHFVYGKPLISYYLWGKTTLEKMRYRPDDFYEKNKVQWKGGKTVTAIDPTAGQVICSDGEAFLYDKLLIATGSTPFVPPFKGLDSVKDTAYTFMNLDDALSLEQVLAPDKKVLIIGAGLIGLKCAEGIFDRVASVTVCDLADRVLPSILDEECAAPIAEALKKQGIRLMLGDSVAEFTPGRALMNSGTAVDFDIAVLAVGVRPAAALAKEAGIAVGRGILINTRSETSLPNIFAAGDCAEGPDASIGENRILAILPNAYLQGHTAGVNMAGGSETHEKAVPMNSIGFFGTHIISAGSYFGQCKTVEKDGTLKKFYYSDDRLNGFIVIGDVKRAGIYTSLVREKTPLSSIDFELIAEKPQLLAFAESERAVKLAGKKAAE